MQVWGLLGNIRALQVVRVRQMADAAAMRPQLIPRVGAQGRLYADDASGSESVPRSLAGRSNFTNYVLFVAINLQQ